MEVEEDKQVVFLCEPLWYRNQTKVLDALIRHLVPLTGGLTDEFRNTYYYYAQEWSAGFDKPDYHPPAIPSLTSRKNEFWLKIQQELKKNKWEIETSRPTDVQAGLVTMDTYIRCNRFPITQEHQTQLTEVLFTFIKRRLDKEAPEIALGDDRLYLSFHNTAHYLSRKRKEYPAEPIK